MTDTRPEAKPTIEDLNPELEGLGSYEFGWHDSDAAGSTAERGLNEAVVRDISSKVAFTREPPGNPREGPDRYVVITPCRWER